VTSSTASIKSGTVGNGAVTASHATKGGVAENGTPVTAAETLKSEEGATTDSSKDSRPSNERFFSASENIARGL
jgi:hypothetical protein